LCHLLGFKVANFS